MYCNEYRKLFMINHTIKNVEVNVEQKPGSYPIQQKARPVPYHLQDGVRNDINRMIEEGHLEGLETVEENCFVSSVVNMVKRTNSSKSR